MFNSLNPEMQIVIGGAIGTIVGLTIAGLLLFGIEGICLLIKSLS